MHFWLIFCRESTRLSSAIFIIMLGCNVWQVLTKPLSVDLPAAVLGFEGDLLGDFRVAGWFGGTKQASYLWQR